ncbi:helix-turn-helix domain-containing protein [Limnobacter humi]|uniref:Helix-turn-helix domain-containing protein n=1 Tax=Limnobacter humi TaxID=1778671 RepID=A0ABT1WJN2_9BURK|nr:helix-turn-helix transcriptional regulator [Limnobacter humi]MCQ8897717.1 helix-turn-helix domain-containing protein [Limnobacter humi]
MPKKQNPALAAPAVVQAQVLEWGVAIRTQRLLQRLTAAQLATRLGVSLPTLSRIEKGDPAVGIGTVLSALYALGLNTVATPPLPQALLQGVVAKRTRLSRQESGDDLGYF